MGSHLVRSGFQLRSGNFNLDRTDKFQVWERVVQSNTFVTGNSIYYDGTTYVAARANAAATAEAIGMVQVADAGSFVYVQSGRITGLSDSILDTGSITAGTVYYLSSATAGKLTATEPAAGNVVKPMMVATSATSGIILNYLGTIAVKTNFDVTVNASATVAVDSVLVTDSYACAWHVAVRDSGSTVFRSAIVQAVWSASATEFSEIGTKELGGSTSDITFTVTVATGTVTLNAVNGGSSNGWDVRAKRVLI